MNACGLDELTPQEEMDTYVVLYLKYAVQLGNKSTPDTDIFVILLHHAHSILLTIYLDTGWTYFHIGNVSDLAETNGVANCTIVLGLHVFTGEDVTSAFKDKGKNDPLFTGDDVTCIQG